jgi:hypothetical protein
VCGVAPIVEVRDELTSKLDPSLNRDVSVDHLGRELQVVRDHARLDAVGAVADGADEVFEQVF